MAAAQHAPRPSAPYRSNAAPPTPGSPRSKRLHASLFRALAGPPLVAGALVAIPSFAFGLQNGIARDHRSFVVGSLAWGEDAVAWVFLATLPLLAIALLWKCGTLSAPGAFKRRYVTRTLLRHALLVALGVFFTRGLSPRASLPLLASTARADGRPAFVYRHSWGCAYDLRAGDGPGMAKPVTVVGPFACDAPPPRVAWEGNDLKILAADGETIGTWPADH